MVNQQLTSVDQETDPAVAPFLTKDYELKVRYLSDQFTRMWTRFNYFLVLESALFVAFVAFYRETDPNEEYATYVAIAAAVVGACWYVFGAQDKYLVETYRSQIRFLLAEMLRGKLLPSGTPFLSQASGGGGNEGKGEPVLNYPYTGGTSPGPGRKIKKTLFQWRADKLSTTTLAAAFPALLSLAWVVVAILVASSD